MNVILLQRIAKLGQAGDEVAVKAGYAKNFLLNGRAILATKNNRAWLAGQRQELEAKNLGDKKEAEALAAKIDGQGVIIIQPASETGQLYGSVTSKILATALEQKGIHVDPRQISIDAPIKTLGRTQFNLNLHADVSTSIAVNVARTVEEAARQEEEELQAAEKARLEDAQPDPIIVSAPQETPEETTEDLESAPTDGDA